MNWEWYQQKQFAWLTGSWCLYNSKIQIICAMESLDGKDFLGYYHGLIHYAQTEFTLQKKCANYDIIGNHWN